MDGQGALDILDEALTRREALKALDERPLHRQELENRLDVSKTTCHRIIRSFDGYGVVRRTGEGYRLSRLGEVVMTELDQADRNVATARELDPVLTALDGTDVDFDVSLFADATITRAQPDDPYPPISRFMTLLRQSSTLRSLDKTSIAPLHVDEIFERIFAGGLTVEAIYPQSVIKKLLSEYHDYHRQAAELGRFSYRVHDDISFGMSLFDERVGLRAYDAETGALRLFADTGDPEAVAWAEDVFGEYYDQAENPDWLPDWVTDWASDLDEAQPQ